MAQVLMSESLNHLFNWK